MDVVINNNNNIVMANFITVPGGEGGEGGGTILCWSCWSQYNSAPAPSMHHLSFPQQTTDSLRERLATGQENVFSLFTSCSTSCPLPPPSPPLQIVSLSSQAPLDD